MGNQPRVVITSGGVFHTYHIAQAAARAGLLHRLIVAAPDTVSASVPKDKVKWLRLPLAFNILVSQLTPRLQAWGNRVADRWFDQSASHFIDDADIVHVFNHQGLKTLTRARAQGSVTIVERCSAHPETQREILSAGYASQGMAFPGSHPSVVSRSIAEYELADAIMVCSEFVARSMYNNGVPEAKLYRIHLGFAPELFSPGKQHDRVFRVIYAGLLSIRKGIHHLLAAFSQLDRPNAELVLVGDSWPEIRPILREYAGRFRHVPFLPRQELVAQFQQASVFVMPSLEDGFGMVVYEAAACGLPIIWSDHVGASLRDGTDGYQFKAGDVADLTKRLQDLYDAPDRRTSMGKSAADYVRQYTWERYYDELSDHYHNLWTNRG